MEVADLSQCVEKPFKAAASDPGPDWPEYLISVHLYRDSPLICQGHMSKVLRI
jgi:hypothetical protein